MEIRRISGSEFKTWRRCRRKWYLSYYLARGPRVADASALTLGTLTHQGMESLYVNLDLDEALHEVLTLGLSLMEGVPEGGESQWMTQISHAQNFTTGYWNWLRDTGADQRYEHIASEQELETDLAVINGKQWKLIGKLDRRVLDRLLQQERFMDFKTVAGFDQFVTNCLRDEQFPTYSLLLERETGEKVKGGIWRMILKQQRARPMNAEKEYFKDYDRTYNDQVLESIWVRYVMMAHEIAEVEARLDEHDGPIQNYDLLYPNPTFSCAWDCDFRHVCDMFDDGSRIGSAVEETYVSIDPYERYKEKR